VVRRTTEHRKGLRSLTKWLVSPTLAVLPAMLEGQPVILVVEDEVLIRMMLAAELRGRGFNVVEAQNADEALTLVQFRLA
jgi:PleD family two-component response regulator